MMSAEGFCPPIVGLQMRYFATERPLVTRSMAHPLHTPILSGGRLQREREWWLMDNNHCPLVDMPSLRHSSL